MAISLNVPYLSYDEIGKITYQLLCKFKYHLTVPVPSDDLIELDLRINICLLEGLLDGQEIEGWTTSDVATIQMDASIFKHRESKLIRLQDQAGMMLLFVFYLMKQSR